MPDYLTRDRLAVLAALAVPLALAAILVPFRTSFPNTDAALAMLLVVVAVAANRYRLAGVLAAVSAAVWFDFFLTQPYGRFSITHRTDIETTVLLLVIGVAVTEIAVWGHHQHAASRRAGYLEGINSAARAMTAGGSRGVITGHQPAHSVALVAIMRLPVRRRRDDRPARMQDDGSVTLGHRAWDVDAEGFPEGTDIELLVESGGLFQGRFLMTPIPGAGPAGTAAAGGRVRQPGRRRAGHEAPGRPGLTGNPPYDRAGKTCVWRAPPGADGE